MEKAILIILALFTLSFSYSQKLRTDEIDAFEGTKKKITKFYRWGNAKGTYIRWHFAKYDNRTFIRVANSGLGCAGASGNYIQFKFNDGTFLKYDDIAEIDCGTYGLSSFLINEDDFKNRTVDMIRLKKSEYRMDFVNKKSKYTVHQMIKAVQ